MKLLLIAFAFQMAVVDAALSQTQQRVHFGGVASSFTVGNNDGKLEVTRGDIRVGTFKIKPSRTESRGGLVIDLRGVDYQTKSPISGNLCLYDLNESGYQSLDLRDFQITVQEVSISSSLEQMARSVMTGNMDWEDVSSNGNCINLLDYEPFSVSLQAVPDQRGYLLIGMRSPSWEQNNIKYGIEGYASNNRSPKLELWDDNQISINLNLLVEAKQGSLHRIIPSSFNFKAYGEVSSSNLLTDLGTGYVGPNGRIDVDFDIKREFDNIKIDVCVDDLGMPYSYNITTPWNYRCIRSEEIRIYNYQAHYADIFVEYSRAIVSENRVGEAMRKIKAIIKTHDYATNTLGAEIDSELGIHIVPANEMGNFNGVYCSANSNCMIGGIPTIKLNELSSLYTTASHEFLHHVQFSNGLESTSRASYYTWSEPLREQYENRLYTDEELRELAFREGWAFAMSGIIMETSDVGFGQHLENTSFGASSMWSQQWFTTVAAQAQWIYDLIDQGYEQGEDFVLSVNSAKTLFNVMKNNQIKDGKLLYAYMHDSNRSTRVLSEGSDSRFESFNATLARNGLKGIPLDKPRINYPNQGQRQVSTDLSVVFEYSGPADYITAIFGESGSYNRETDAGNTDLSARSIQVKALRGERDHNIKVAVYDYIDGFLLSDMRSFKTKKATLPHTVIDFIFRVIEGDSYTTDRLIIKDGGTFIIEPGGSLELTSGATVMIEKGGTLEINGSDEKPASLYSDRLNHDIISNRGNLNIVNFVFSKNNIVSSGTANLDNVTFTEGALVSSGTANLDNVTFTEGGTASFSSGASHLTNVSFKNADYCISADGITSSLVINQARFEGCGVAIKLNGAPANIRNTFISDGTSGIVSNNTYSVKPNIYIDNLDINRLNDWGISVFYSNLSMQNSRIRNNGGGIYMWSSFTSNFYNNELIGNTSDHSRAGGLLIEGGSRFYMGKNYYNSGLNYIGYNSIYSSPYYDDGSKSYEIEVGPTALLHVGKDDPYDYSCDYGLMGMNAIIPTNGARKAIRNLSLNPVYAERTYWSADSKPWTFPKTSRTFVGTVHTGCHLYEDPGMGGYGNGYGKSQKTDSLYNYRSDFVDRLYINHIEKGYKYGLDYIYKSADSLGLDVRDDTSLVAIASYLAFVGNREESYRLTEHLSNSKDDNMLKAVHEIELQNYFYQFDGRSAGKSNIQIDYDSLGASLLRFATGDFTTPASYKSSPTNPPLNVGGSDIYIKRIGPNPSRDAVRFLISSPNTCDIDISIHDMSGKRVATQTIKIVSESEVIEMYPGIASGVYLARFAGECDNGSVISTTEQVVIVR